ncbi:hypothetical protein HLH36_02595 [Gluconacetobacter aggeris]|uniref:Uncharacterized protein n=1 Tax=Gluconacetobacter aggeris TaxID=1286186 RepID=A0A7W4IQL6_9PROT|nr:hypothetical protein [Gluconacetobacter aggeris]MBB2167255.1 hypothetical protein [Gluconacetobacter aggeris]
MAFLFFVALTGFAQPETLTSRPRVADAGGERPMMGPNHPKAVRSLPIVRQAVDDIASLAFLVRLLSNVPHSMVDGVAERSALRFLSVEIDVRAAKIMEALG